MALCIQGGNRLEGHVVSQGAKNAVLPMLFAVLLSEEPITLCGVPNITDVSAAIELLSMLGVAVEREGECVTLCAKDAHPSEKWLSIAADIRASSYLLGASLARFGMGEIPWPGGCALGTRPLDLHRDALVALGARYYEEESGIRVCADGLRGTQFALSYPSVGATVNFLLAALAAEGESILYGYAREHHVMDFISFLRTLGATIQVDGRCITVKKSKLHGGRYRVSSDAMEAGTYLIACAAVGGDVAVSRVRDHELAPLLLAFRKMGVSFSVHADEIRVSMTRPLRGMALVAAPAPAFPTDLHPPMTVLLSRSPDGGSVCDHVFQDRFSYLSELEKMGLRYVKSGRTVTVYPSDLKGGEVTAPDLRGGAALIVAALAAEGETVIKGDACIDRGYEAIERKLFNLGASVHRDQR